jgi:hemolysin activation/secretion protein
MPCISPAAKRPGAWRLPAALVLAAVAGAARADPPLAHNDPNQVAPLPPPQASAPLAVPTTGAASTAEDTAPRFVLKGASFDGASALSASALRPAWAPFVGKPVSLADLRAIGHAAEAIYARDGFPFIAVLLKVQQVEDGVVRYDVIEGKISGVTVLGADPVARRQATAMLEPLVNRAPLSLADVETAYELARRVPGLSISGALRRSETPGGMDLVVDARREGWRAYVNVNDLYADAVGPWGVLVGLDYNGGSQYGDTTSLEAYTSIPVGRQVLFHTSYSQGLDADGLTATVSALVGTANPKGSAIPLELATNIEALHLEAAQPLWERPNSNVVLTAAFDASNQRTQVFGNQVESDDKLRIFSLGVAGELTSSLGRLAASASVRQGVDFLGASRPGDTDLSRVGGDPQALVFHFGLEGQTPSRFLVQLAVRIDAQQTADALTAPDEYSVGNLTIGRGYQPGEILGDSALGGSFEFRLGPVPIQSHFTAQPFAFVDAVRLWNNNDTALFRQGLFSSVGGGVRFQIAGKFNLELTYAVPQDSLPTPGVPKPSPLVLVNLTVGLTDAFEAIHRRLAPKVSS